MESYLVSAWVPPHAAYPEPLSYQEPKKGLDLEVPITWDWDTRSLLRTTTRPSEVNKVLKYNKGRAQNNLSSEIFKKRVHFCAFPRKKTKIP